MKSSLDVAVETLMREFIDRCRSQGMNVTPQRLAIYRALLEARDHPSPELLFDRVKPAMPSMSLATIYKTLDTLARMGLVTELPATGDSRRYDANQEPHQHLVCTGCGEVVDYRDPALEKVVPPKGIPGFTAHHVSIHIHGFCQACARAGKAH